MKIKLNQISLDDMYLRAKTSFQYCIARDDNAVLNNEIDKPLNEITAKNEWIKIQFFGSDKNHYIVEVRLLLFSQSDEKIGYYCFHENENEDTLDEYLVFE